MQQIIRLQGGNAEISSDAVMNGAKTTTISAKRSGFIRTINNRTIDDIARMLGAPDHQFGGIYLHRKLGQRIQRGQPLITLSSHSRERLQIARRSKAVNQILIIRST